MPEFCQWACGRKANSDEDVLPQWARDYLGAKAGRKNWVVRDLTPAGLTTPAGNRRADVPLRGFRLPANKMVCEECNNHWMSELQNQVKDLLIPMMAGEAVELGPAAVATIRKWAAMTGITLEYAGGAPRHYPGGVAVDFSRRHHLYAEGSAAPNTFVFLTKVAESDLKVIVNMGREIRLAHEDYWPDFYAELFVLESLGFFIIQGRIAPWREAVLREAGTYLVSLPAVIPDLTQSVRWPPETITPEHLLELWEEVMPEKASLPDPMETPAGALYIATREPLESERASETDA